MKMPADKMTETFADTMTETDTGADTSTITETTDTSLDTIVEMTTDTTIDTVVEKTPEDATDSGASSELRRSLKSLLIEISVLAAVLTAVFTVFFGITIQHGNDMYPALRDGDVILYFRLSDLMNTEACVYEADGSLHTGRVEAGSGTVISATGDMQLTFDGIYLPVSSNDGIYDRTYAAEGELLPVTVRDGYYFILGDNRAGAKDSRVYGQIGRRQIKGRIVAVLRQRGI